jgi:hypothetical protein
MRSARAVLCFLLFSFIVLLFPQQLFAQTASYPATPIGAFNTPNVDSDVPRNQHYFAQAATIEVLSAVHCILTGVDFVNPEQGCLGVNTETGKLSLSKPQYDENGQIQASGLLGATTDLIAGTYQPIVSTSTYISYVGDNFGVVKKAHAQTPCDPSRSGYGFCGLQPILKLWENVRNIAFILLTLAFIFIGLGVMLRVKIDPRTVMTVQNQIPNVIISMILITLSYAIAALMVDTMWITTYSGVYMLTRNHDPVIGDCTKEFNKNPNDKGESLSKKATTTILQMPFTFFNQVFARCTPENNIGPLPQNDRDGGFHVMTSDVSNNFGQTIGNVARSIIFDKNDEVDCGGWRKLSHPIKCLKKGAVSLVATLVSAIVKIIVFVILLLTLFKIWFNLVKAYIYTLLYIILSPVMIVFGLLPKKPLGFENWLRRLFVNVAVFPITVFMFVAARLLLDLYSKTGPDQFIPPLIGNPSTGVNFGAIMAFGVLLITPHIQTILQEKMGVKGIGSPGLIGAGIAGGMAVVGAPASRAMKHLNRHDNRGQAVGAVAVGKEKAGNAVFGLGAKLGSKRAARKLEEREFMKTPGYLMGNQSLEEHRETTKKRLTDRESVKAWREEREKRKKNGDDASAGDKPKAWQVRKRWQDRKEKKNAKPEAPTTDFHRHSTIPPGGSGSAAGTGAGAGSPTITGPITAMGQVIVPGMKFGEDKKGMLKSMYEKYREKSKPEGTPATGAKLEHILKDFGEHLEHMATPETVNEINDAHVTNVFNELEEKHKDKPAT